MKPVYQNAIVAEDGKKKLYETNRVIQIFNLVVKPKNNAFTGNLISVGDICTEEDIKAAMTAYEKSVERTNHLEEMQRKHQEELDLIRAYKESLIGIRECIINTNNGKVFLLPENHSLVGMYQSFLDLESLNGKLFDFIEKHSTSMVDTFILETVTKLTADKLMEVEDAI